MNKLLKIEIAVLVLLLIVAGLLRFRVLNDTDEPQADGPALAASTGDTAESTQATEHSEPSQPEEAQPEETEPPLQLTFAEDFTLESRTYFVYDCNDDNVLALSGELTDRVYPASVTKLFTAYVALQYLDPDTVVTLGQEVNLVASDSSLAYVKRGQSLTVARLVEGMLLPSGNDAAYGLAVAAARAQSGNANMGIDDALTYFVALMNETAAELGMTGSHFANPDGYHDPDHYLSLGDLITVGKLALENEVIRSCTSTVEDRVELSSGSITVWHNTNSIIDPSSQYYNEDAIGLKTGYTSTAGFCLLTAFDMDGRYILIGSFGCVRPEDRFIDTLKLYDLVVEAFAAQ